MSFLFLSNYAVSLHSEEEGGYPGALLSIYSESELLSRHKSINQFDADLNRLKTYNFNDKQFYDWASDQPVFQWRNLEDDLSRKNALKKRNISKKKGARQNKRLTDY